MLKVPEKQITLIMLSNSTALNSPFLLSETGDVLTSAFALGFLRTVVDEDRLGRSLPAPDWSIDAEKFSEAVAYLNAIDRDHYGRVAEAHAAILRYLASREGRVRKEVSLDSRMLDPYVGKYSLNATQTVSIMKNAKGLVIEYPGQSQVALFAASETLFFLKIADTQVLFIRDENERVTRLLLRSSANEREAVKVE